MTSTSTDILSRIASLEEARNTINFKEAQEKAEAFNRKEILEMQIKGMKQDIQDLIKLANAVLNNGFKLNSHYSNDMSNTKDNYITNSITHKIGFCNSEEFLRNKVVTYIGINAGGFCGKISFRTDGDKIFGVDYESKTVCSNITEPPLKYLEEFVEDFPKFKKEFLDYVDRLSAKATK